MHTVTKDPVTGAYLGYCGAETDPRLCFALQFLAYLMETTQVKAERQTD